MESEGRTRILIVEDEWLISANLADLLTDWGCEVLGPAAGTRDALALLERELPHCALLDVTLGSEKSFPVADVLAGKGIPFVFLTGYQAADLPERFAEGPMIAKPIRDTDLKRALMPLIDGLAAKAPS